MTTAYTSLLGLALPVTGELSGTWGDTVNTAITSLLDTAVAGTTSITTDADITLTTTTGASNQARQAIILWNPASGTTTRNITAPAQSKIYTVINASGGTQSIVIRGAGPTTGVTIAKGESATVAWNGSDFVKVGSSGGAITFTDLTVTGNTILGDAAADTLTVNATSTFASPVSFQNLVRLPSTGRSAAAALTVTNPAFLYGVASTYTDTTSSGTVAFAPFYGLAQPTLSTSNVTTYTNAATLYIANAPTTGGSATITNPFALYVAAGASYLGGNLTLNAGTANGVAYLDGSKVLTTGSALTFDGARTLSLSNTGAVLATIQSTSTSGGRSAILRLNVANTSGDDPAGAIAFTYGAGFTAAASIEVTSTPSILKFLIGTSEQMRLTGNALGVGTTDEYGRLNVQRFTGAPLSTIALGDFSVSGNSVGIYGRVTSGGIFGISSAGAPHVFYLGGPGTTEGMRLDSTGLGIATSFPAASLHVTGTGSLVAGTPPALSATDPTYSGVALGFNGTDNLGQVVSTNPSGAALGFYTKSGSGSAPAQRLHITGTGNIGLATTTPQARLHVVGSTWVTSDNTLSGVTADGLTTRFTGNVSYLQSVTVSSGTVTGGRDLSFDGNQLLFRTISGASFGEKARITNGGDFLLNYTSNTYLGSTTFSLLSYRSGNNSLGVAGGSYTIPQLGQLYLSGGYGDGTTGRTSGFFIRSQASGGGGNVTNDLQFVAQLDNGNSEVIRARITNAGNMGLGATPPAWLWPNGTTGALQLQDGAAFSGYNEGAVVSQNWYYNAGEKFIANGFATRYSQFSGIHAWSTSTASNASGAGAGLTWAESMRITTGGRIAMGSSGTPQGRLGVFGITGGSIELSIDSNPNYGELQTYSSKPLYLQRQGNNVFSNVGGGAFYVGKDNDEITSDGWTFGAIGTGGTTFTVSNNEFFTYNNYNGSGSVQMDFRWNNSEVGSISYTSSAVSFNQTSDYRLKDNPQPLTGSGAFIDALKPRTWAWKIDGSRGVGFIAHEVQEVSPTTVTGEKDAVREDGVTPKYQSVAYGSPEFIANIILELQSLRQRVAQLETGV